jgi:alpha-pyrone synthase
VPFLRFSRIAASKLHARIAGIGTALPPHRADIADITRFLTRVAEAQPEATPRFIRYVSALARRAGIGARHSVLKDYLQADCEGFEFYPKNWKLDPFPTTADRMRVYRESAVPLAERAAVAALQQADIAPDEITHLIVTTCTGFFAPGPDIQLIQRLGLKNSVQRSQIGFLGCYAGITGLRTAHQLIAGNPSARVLLVSVELCSLHYQRIIDVQTLVANILFGDGAAAVVLSAEHEGPQIVGSQTSLAPSTEGEMGWHIGDHGFVMTLGERVPEHLEGGVQPFVQGLADSAGVQIQDVQGWAIHPGSRHVVEAVGRGLGLQAADLETSLGVLDKIGNVSSATVLFVLEALIQSGWRGPGMALAFGPGLTMEGVALHA